MLIDSKRKGGWGQKWCYHGPDEFELDISGKNVLIGREFYYDLLNTPSSCGGELHLKRLQLFQ